MKSVYLFLLLPFFLLATPTPSRNNSRIAQIFTTVNGLPDNTINDIQKDKEGYLWIATNKGIARFDGKNFISFSKNTHPLFFKDNVVNEIQIDDNSIYLIFNNTCNIYSWGAIRNWISKYCNNIKEIKIDICFCKIIRNIIYGIHCC